MKDENKKPEHKEKLDLNGETANSSREQLVRDAIDRIIQRNKKGLQKLSKN